MTQKIGAALLSYADTIWKTADTLRGAGIKEGDFPSFMMPFFALMLLESRLRRFKKEKVAEFQKAMGVKFDPEQQEHREWLASSARAANKGYHRELLIHDKGLKETCLVPGGNFRNRLIAHLDQYDPETKRLLGLGYAEGDPKFLDIQGKASDLFARPNSPLYAFAMRWAAIDLTKFSNSEVTTIEEHIKRRWGDISAETAGEQYTPSDVIELATSLIVELRKEGRHSGGIADVYDMACGGGNFLFATEDALRDAFPRLSIRTRGQELNDALYALAAIEARFREDARIERENTLTNDLFLSDKFDVIVANPPYGVDWKDSKAGVEADASGRFQSDRLPPISDGQLLFLQHAAFHLSESGVGTIVHNGSTLFSGEAGSGESETRKWLIKEHDIVEAVVQLPRGEFFNTSISTYIWILNKAKPRSRKGFVLLINAETCFKKLDKNLNQKNCKIDDESRERIVTAFRNFEDGPISRKLSIDELLYNKVDIELHRHDEEGRAVAEEEKISADLVTVFLDDLRVVIRDGILDTTDVDGESAKEVAVAFNEAAKSALTTSIETDAGICYQRDNETGQVFIDGVPQGLGTLIAKAKVAKSKGLEIVKVAMAVAPLLEKDSELTAYSSNPTDNESLIMGFLDKWVDEPFRVLDVKIGCEINFNRIFPKKIDTRPVKDILKDMAAIEKEIAKLDARIASDAMAGR